MRASLQARNAQKSVAEDGRRGRRVDSFHAPLVSHASACVLAVIYHVQANPNIPLQILLGPPTSPPRSANTRSFAATSAAKLNPSIALSRESFGGAIANWLANGSALKRTDTSSKRRNSCAHAARPSTIILMPETDPSE